MGEKEPIYSIYGDSSRYSHATEQRALDRVKSEALEALNSMDVRFPVNSRKELLDAMPGDRPTHCSYEGRTLSLKELAGSLRDNDFPLHDIVEAATLLAAACPIQHESPEGSPEEKPF